MQDGRRPAVHENGMPYLPVACGDICQVISPWPGCGKPANEIERLAATEKLHLIGKDPHPALQRYVNLISTCYQVSLRAILYQNSLEHSSCKVDVCSTVLMQPMTSDRLM